MTKLIITACCVAFIGGATGASAQTTGPAGQQDTNKIGTANPGSGMTKGGMTSGTSSTGMTKDGMSNNMNRGAESKDGDGMPKGGMKKN